MSMIIGNNSGNDGKNSHLGFPKYSHIGEVIFAIFGIAVMLFPLFVDMGAVPPVIGTEIFGFCFLLIGAATLIDSVKKEKRMQRAYNEGKAFTGVITRIEMRARKRNTGARRRIHYYAAECEMVDPDTNEKYLYSSHYVREKLYDYEGRQVTIYVDMKDRSNYYVDLSSIR